MAAKVGFSYLCPQGVVELYSKIADQGYTIMFLTNRWKPKLPKVFNINFKVQGYRSVWDDVRLYQVVVRGKIQNASGTGASPGFQIAPRSYCGSWSPYQSFCWVSAEWNIKGGISVGSPWDRAAERTTGGEQDCSSQVRWWWWWWWWCQNLIWWLLLTKIHSRVRGLFPGREPFWAGYGNKAWDILAYKVLTHCVL